MPPDLPHPTASPARPSPLPLHSRITLRLDIPLRNRLHSIAIADDRSISSILRLALRQYITARDRAAANPPPLPGHSALRANRGLFQAGDSVRTRRLRTPAPPTDQGQAQRDEA